MKPETEVLELQAKECQGLSEKHQKLEKRKKRFSFNNFRANMARSAP